jgi:hypothetical protein
VNPASLVFVVRCFSRAEGALALGSPESEFSWFSGYAWQVAICGRCRAHVGWLYAGAGAPFAGLIEERVREG